MTKKDEPLKIVIPQLIVGLGNPEPKYDQTRHNIGFMAVDILSNHWSISLTSQRKFQGIFGEGRSPQNSQVEKIRLLKPTTYMNLSGQAIRAVTDWYKIPPETVLIIYDDMDLPLGKLRLRLSGSAGGHNGMKSAIAHLGTQNFPRLRIGIGKPKIGMSDDTVSHVLGKFSLEEVPAVNDALKLVNNAVETCLSKGVTMAMNRYNA